MKKYICTHCGSDNVLFDAQAKWNPAKQAFELHETDQTNAFCVKCDGECNTQEVEHISENPEEDKFQMLVHELCQLVDERNGYRLDTCDAPNWNKFHWNNRFKLISAVRAKGYIVEPITRHGVLEIHVSKK